jgi:predicted Abi (CAAX) family protease
MLILGALLFLYRDHYQRLLSTAGIAAAAAAILMLGSAAGILVQMSWALAFTGPEAAAVVTCIFIILAAIPGILCLRVALSPSPSWTGRDRVTLIAAGILALVVWSGFIIGPVLAVVAAVLPQGR